MDYDIEKIKKNDFPFLKLRTGSWIIGIYTGKSPFKLNFVGDITNPVLTAEDVSDMAAQYVADPFIIREHGSWYMFFEVLGRSPKKGVISFAVSDDGISWT